jgi:hypothetical protein
LASASAFSRRLPLAAEVLLLAVVAAVPHAAGAQEDHSGLTRESFRRNCLLCHHTAAPEGVSPQILAGLHPVAGLKPADAMPGLVCWRRCDACKLPDPKRRPK